MEELKLLSCLLSALYSYRSRYIDTKSRQSAHARCCSICVAFKMSVRASALVRRHPLVLFLVLAALLTGLYLHHGQHAVSSRSAFELSSSMAHFSFSDHFARLQNGHWHASSGYGQDSAKETSSNTRRILLQPEDAFKEQDGLVYLADIARPGANPSNKVEHPILYLIRQAKKDWQKKVDSQSKDLATAVKTYKLKYGRAPPKGFDRW